MKVSKNAIELIKKFEGCPTLNGYPVAYIDTVGVWTIGYGTTNADYSITKLQIKKGVTITRKQAEDFLVKSLEKKYLKDVEKYAPKDVNQNMVDALLSFAYNVGSIKGLTKDGTRTIEEISNKILEYNKGTVRGKKVVIAGLDKRRKAEKQLFDTPTEPQEKKYVKVNCKNGLNLRNDKGKILTTVKNNTKMELVKNYATSMTINNINYDMTKVKYNNKEYYCASKYIKGV